MDKRVLIVAVLAVLAGCFLGKGITGFAASQNCCFGWECPEAKRCTAHVMENPAPSFSFLIGGLVLLIIVIFFILKFLGQGF